MLVVFKTGKDKEDWLRRRGIPFGARMVAIQELERRLNLWRGAPAGRSYRICLRGICLTISTTRTRWSPRMANEAQRFGGRIARLEAGHLEVISRLNHLDTCLDDAKAQVKKNAEIVQKNIDV